METTVECECGQTVRAEAQTPAVLGKDDNGRPVVKAEASHSYLYDAMVEHRKTHRGLTQAEWSAAHNSIVQAKDRVKKANTFERTATQ